MATSPSVPIRKLCIGFGLAYFALLVLFLGLYRGALSDRDFAIANCKVAVAQRDVALARVADVLGSAAQVDRASMDSERLPVEGVAKETKVEGLPSLQSGVQVAQRVWASLGGSHTDDKSQVVAEIVEEAVGWRVPSSLKNALLAVRNTCMVVFVCLLLQLVLFYLGSRHVSNLSLQGAVDFKKFADKVTMWGDATALLGMAVAIVTVYVYVSRR
ncbi:hypothetical protein JCM3775_005599 [Rhodotorula graminis]|uniref:Uncharacterized protein n=1 Tax=Rhodotorula graminis (strain WP1) TaxID=578459 RepID=A0A194SDZ8_RHOGW|nr:uncharacterized protein RHOBADRAFT_41677 [Rhodotorula graminis WP1]KPV77681.1 hypothetical protein RHOBADRAFT_41677 [Rhodotorula graminis WP1]